MEFLGLNDIPFARVFTKSDKLNSTALEDSVNQYNSEMLKNWESLPASFITSAVKGNGRVEILNYIEESMNNFSNGS
jgi:GTP-binding protein